MHALNYLGSLLSTYLVEMHPESYLKCLSLLVQNSKKSLKVKNDNVFNISLIQNLALIYSRNHAQLKAQNSELHNTVYKLLF
jgi:hypothetical protein